MSINAKMPFRFSRPDERSREVLTSLIGALPIVQEEKLKKNPVWKDHPVRDVLIETVKNIHANLESDYLQNMSEAPEVPWTFDYQLSLSDFGKGMTGLEVFTRLLGPPEEESGAIMYGTFVFRIADCCFIHWPDQGDEEG